MERGISLNDLEKRSFYSFLVLYLGSSLLFVFLSGYLYYSAQKNSLESETYYKLEHLADHLSGLIIKAHMMGTTLQLPKEDGFEYKLVPVGDKKDYIEGYFEKNGHKMIISSGPREHLNVKYVIVKTDRYYTQLQELQKFVMLLLLLSVISVIIISVLLAKLFMKPVHQRIGQIEEFIQDVSHELNTPITALKMSASRAIKKGVYDKKILTNISISTKQLETIYHSLTYLNFSDKKEPRELVDMELIVQRVVAYYKELSSAKKIEIVCQTQHKSIQIIPSRAELLLSNLLSNAIKYSMPETRIKIVLTQEYLSVEDEGVGIAKEKLDEIFKLYSRESNIAGGFGVGLNIVKQICNEFDINVQVESQLEKGSTFTLLFS